MYGRKARAVAAAVATATGTAATAAAGSHPGDVSVQVSTTCGEPCAASSSSSSLAVAAAATDRLDRAKRDERLMKTLTNIANGSPRTSVRSKATPSSSGPASCGDAVSSVSGSSDDVITTHCDFSTTKSALELVESGDSQAKLEHLQYIMQGYASNKQSIHVSSAVQLVKACLDHTNRYSQTLDSCVLYFFHNQCDLFFCG